MPESPLELQDALPKYLQLLRYGPTRSRFSRDSQRAAAVRTPGDLPPYLILGNLDEDTFRVSSSGWSARWQGSEQETYFEANFIADQTRYEFHQIWRGIDGGYGFCSSEASPEEAVVRCPFLKLPPAWESALKTELEGKYHLSFIERPEKIVTPFCSPDGFFFTIAFPVAVHDIRRFQSLIQEIAARSALSYPVSVAAKRVLQVVNYPEGKAPAWTTDPFTVFKRSLVETGLIPREFLSGKQPKTAHQQPFWPDNLMKRYLRPVARANGIYKNIGWHTFRHTYGTLLKANGEDVKIVQELLRHANSRITLEVYTQAVTSHKRAAQSKVVGMIVPEGNRNEGTKGLGTEAKLARF